LNPKKRWKNVHLEAGLRSGSMFEPFPEEISRNISDQFSDILLAVSDLTEKNLQKYKNKKKIMKMGNTIIDSAKIAYNKERKKYKKLNYKYALINLHRHENLRNEGRMNKIINIISKIKIKIVWPLHDNTEYYLKKYNLFEKIKRMKNIKIMPLVSYPHFLSLLVNCKYLVIDGGSIQEESLVFKKPCIILRKRTERQEGLLTGINFLTRLNERYAEKIIEKIENNKIKIKNFINPLGTTTFFIKFPGNQTDFHIKESTIFLLTFLIP